jgi:formylglycine-generating enzyme required for sulfatase activity
MESKTSGIFISHITEDKPRVREVNRRLRDRGYRTWIDEDLLGGQEWDEQIQRAMDKAEAVIVFLSSHAVKKESYYQEEIEWALRRQAQQPEGKIFLIPVLLEECELPRNLAKLQRVRLRDPDGWEKLLASLNQVQKPTPGKPTEQVEAVPLFQPGVPALPAGPRFTWLHLSGFRFGSNDDWQGDPVLRALQRDVIDWLAAEGPRPDCVFVAGDIARSGKPEEYAQAERCFSTLAARLNHDPHAQWFLCPGEHDVNRDAINPMLIGNRDKLTEKDAPQLLGMPSTWRSFAERQQAFLDFTGLILGSERAWHADTPWEVRQYEIAGLKTAILSLNTAWSCENDADDGNLVMGEFQVRQALAAADEFKPDLKIALFHHPFDSLLRFDARAVREILGSDGGCCFILRGHLQANDPVLSSNRSPGGSCLELAAGNCAGEEAEPLLALVVSLDLESGQGEVHAWGYSPRSGGFWHPDNHLYQGMTDGRWQFDLPEDIVRKDAPPPAPRSVDLIPKRYRRQLEEQCGHIEPILLSDRPLVFRLRDVYVPLETSGFSDGEVDAEAQEDEQDILGARIGREGMTPRILLTDLLNTDRGPHFLISGVPGSGKSTFMRRAALEEIDRPEPRLPLLLELKNFGEWLGRHPGNDCQLLLSWAEEALAGVGLADLEARLGAGRVVWLLDGLDEIFDTTVRLRAARIIGEWLRTESGRGDRLLLTSRPHAFDQPGVITALDLAEARKVIEPLAPESQREFLGHWFIAIYGEEGTGKAEALLNDLWTRVERHPTLPDLRGNPLMLSIIATIYHQGKDLPDRRAELYEQAVLVLLQRRFGPDAPGGGDQLVREMRQGLMSVALGMMEKGEVREIGEADFLELLRAGMYENRKPTAREAAELEQRANELGCHSGLLGMEGVPSRYAFTHLGFQEFLTARAVAQERDPVASLGGRIDKPSWREVVLLTAGYLFENGPGFRGEEFLNALLRGKQANARLPLAVQAAAEAPPGTLGEKLRDDLLGRSMQALTDPKSRREPAERAQLGLAVGRFGDPRLGMDREDRWVKIDAGAFSMGSTSLDSDIPESIRNWAQPVHHVRLQAFLLGRFPVTNIEYRGFIEDGGYRREEYWGEEGWRWRNLTGPAFDAWYAEVPDIPDARREEWTEFFLPDDEPKWWRDAAYNGLNQPVVGVNWFEAEAYCNWLNCRMREWPPDWWESGMQVRLPSEAQWEYGARGPGARTYPWGNQKPTARRANYGEAKLNVTSPVGAFPAGSTPDGLEDMAGNVWEWCRDVWDPDAYAQREAGLEDPLLDAGDSARRVVRGGSWINQALNLAGAFRSGSWSGVRLQNGGFRCCVSVSAEQGSLGIGH